MADATVARRGRLKPRVLPHLVRLFGENAAFALSNPGTFTMRALRAFKANQGLLLAGAVAYYTLLSIVPVLILMLIALSRFVDQQELLDTLGRYLEWLIPGESAPVIGELARFVENRAVMGMVLFVTMLFFSSLAFTVLENAMSVIFVHRVVIRRRHFLISAILPYCYIVALGVGLLIVTLVAGSLQAMGAESVEFLGYTWSLSGLSGVLLYFLGVTGEVLVLTSIYMVMPVGRLKWRHALFGGVTATILWEITRHVLVWYFGTLSQVTVVYGSLSASIVVLLSLEIGATLLLFGAQVIAEYERIGTRSGNAPPKPMRT
jgi:YihY family inner membrane protein